MIQNDTKNAPLPDGWKWVKLGEVCKLRNGYAFKSSDYLNIGVPIIRISDIKEGEVLTKQSVRVRPHKDFEDCLIEKNDILVAMSGATTGKFGIYKNTEKAYQNQRVGNFIITQKEHLQKAFLFHQLHSLKRKIEQDAYGGAQPNISSKKIEEMEIVLPPLSIQAQIVEKLEALLSELDKGKAQLLTAQAQLKTYRQAVLKYAFEGKFTGGVDGWEWVKIAQISEVNTGVTPLRSNKSFWENGHIAWVTSGALNNEYVSEAKEFITETALKSNSLKLYPKNTLLVALYGEGKTRGKCSELLIQSTTNQAIAGIVLKEEFRGSRKFLKLFLLKKYDDLRKLASGGVQPNLNLSLIKNTEVPFPPLSTQAQIVQEIESRLSVCDKLEETLKTSLAQCETLRQSILKRAFEGKLV